jgi:DNA-binding transcriptional MerR regulator
VNEATPTPFVGFLIGEAARRSGVTATNIRYYQQEGLLPARASADNGYRWLTPEDVHQLRFIKQLRGLNMSLPEVRQLLVLNLGEKAHCRTARNMLDTHIINVKAKVAELQELQKTLSDLRAKCDGSAESCLLLEALHKRADEVA